MRDYARFSKQRLRALVQVGPCSACGTLSRRLSMNTSSRISSVPLYLHPERVEEELAAKALGPEAELTVDQVAPFDQMHYYGNISVAGAVGRLGLRPGSRVI